LEKEIVCELVPALGPEAWGVHWLWRMITYWRFISCLNKHSKQLYNGLLSHCPKLHPLTYTEVYLSVRISSAPFSTHSYGKTSCIYSSSVNKTAFHSPGNRQKGSWLKRSLDVHSPCSVAIPPLIRGGS